MATTDTQGNAVQVEVTCAAITRYTDPTTGRTRSATRGAVITVDPTDRRIAGAISRGLLTPTDAPPPAPSVPSDPLGEVLTGTVPSVIAWAAEHPDQVPELLARERDGRDRAGIVDKLAEQAQG